VATDFFLTFHPESKSMKIYFFTIRNLLQMAKFSDLINLQKQALDGLEFEENPLPQRKWLHHGFLRSLWNCPNSAAFIISKASEQTFRCAVHKVCFVSDATSKETPLNQCENLEEVLNEIASELSQVIMQVKQRNRFWYRPVARF